MVGKCAHNAVYEICAQSPPTLSKQTGEASSQRQSKAVIYTVKAAKARPDRGQAGTKLRLLDDLSRKFSVFVEDRPESLKHVLISEIVDEIGECALGALENVSADSWLKGGGASRPLMGRNLSPWAGKNHACPAPHLHAHVSGMPEDTRYRVRVPFGPAEVLNAISIQSFGDTP